MAAKKKDYVPLNLKSGSPISKLLDRDVANEVAATNNERDTWKRYVHACKLGQMQPTTEHARELLTERRARLMKARNDVTDAKKLAPIDDVTVSRAKSVLGISKWNCWENIFGYLSGMDTTEGGRGVNMMTLVMVAASLGNGKHGLKWDRARVDAPPRARVMAIIDKRRKQRRGNGNGASNGKPKAVVDVSTMPKTADKAARQSLQRISAHAKGLQKWFGNSKGAPFIANILRAIDSAKPFIGPRVKELKALAAEAE